MVNNAIETYVQINSVHINHIKEKKLWKTNPLNYETMIIYEPTGMKP